MEDKKNTSQFNTQEDALEIDLSVLFRDFLRSFGKLWLLTILLAAVVAIGALLYSIKSYQPMYKVETTFTVETYNPTQSGYTFFYDRCCISPFLHRTAIVYPFGKSDWRNRKQCDDAFDGVDSDGNCCRVFCWGP